MAGNMAYQRTSAGSIPLGLIPRVRKECGTVVAARNAQLHEKTGCRYSLQTGQLALLGPASTFRCHGIQKGRHDQTGIQNRSLIFYAPFIGQKLGACIPEGAFLLTDPYIHSRVILLFLAKKVISHSVSSHAIKLFTIRYSYVIIYIFNNIN